MKLDQPVTAVRAATLALPGGRWAAAAERHARLAADVLDRVLPGAPRFVGRAPGRLDVLGGSAECSGSLVLNVPVADGVCAAAQARGDGMLSVSYAAAPGTDGAPPYVFPLQQLHDRGGGVVEPAGARPLLSRPAGSMVSAALGAVVEALRAGVLPGLGGGVSFSLGSTLPEACDVAGEMAAAAATLVAACAVMGAGLDAGGAVNICRRVQNDWLGRPGGSADAGCVLLGEGGTLSRWPFDGSTPSGNMTLPEGAAFVGFDCGGDAEAAWARNERVRSAAYMGRTLIARILEHDGAGSTAWDGRLSSISLADYVERFRDRLPTKMKGADFLRRFAAPEDPFLRIEPEVTYKVRSRTEHHIYEHARAVEFNECLSAAVGKQTQPKLCEAGELMLASHWSYGQRCGLGSADADVLVNLVRAQGTAADLYGAKLSGRGCGGTVVVLLRDGERARQALDAICAEYQARTGSETRVLYGSTAGALAAGAQPA